MNNNLVYADNPVTEIIRLKEKSETAIKREYSTAAIPEKKPFFNFVKRTVDIIMSFLGIVLLLPFFIILVIAIKTDSDGKAFYSQKRVGVNGKTFKMYKFRSMVSNANELFVKFTPSQRAEFEVNFKLDKDPRVTRVGEFIRKTSLDELPQLFNILKGDLSIVGPRPIVEYEIYKYGDKAEKFYSVKPGLTGYWQVNGRNDTSYEDRVKMDMFYIDNRTFLLDLKIILKTFSVVIGGKGAY